MIPLSIFFTACPIHFTASCCSISCLHCIHSFLSRVRHPLPRPPCYCY
jgi:hypothetical protein